MYIVYKDLPRLRSKHRDQKIVFASGSFDLTHAGHVLFFEDCKKLGDILVIGVGGNDIIRKNKGPGRPIIHENLRMKMIDSLKPVDYTLLDDNHHNVHSLGFVEHVLEQLKPDIYAINEDAFEPERRVELAKKHGVELKVMSRWCPPEYDAVSTSKLIQRIKNLKVE